MLSILSRSGASALFGVDRDYLAEKQSARAGGEREMSDTFVSEVAAAAAAGNLM